VAPEAGPINLTSRADFIGAEHSGGSDIPTVLEIAMGILDTDLIEGAGDGRP
jgi:hypothetical protein